ncbi:MAG: c-type cytochrome [Pirellulaceae bacterium]
MFVSWRGQVNAREDGTFLFSVFAKGQVTLQIGDQPLKMLADDESPGWFRSEPVELTFGRHNLLIEYRCETQSPAIGVYWSGPSFGLEPLTASYLSHEAAQSASTDHELGRNLSRGLRCAACHTFPHTDDVLPGPSLTHVADNLRPSWLVERLTRTGKDVGSAPDGGMPHFALHRNDAMAISAALFAASESSAAPQDLAKKLQQAEKRRKKSDPAIRTTADAEQGELTFAASGCVACHRAGELGTSQPRELAAFAGGDLSRLVAKRTRAFIARWLVDPASVNSQHRMPVFELTDNQQFDLVEFLSQLGLEHSTNDTRAAGDASRGVGLIAKYRCGACHTLPRSLTSNLQNIEISADSPWADSCTGAPRRERAAPGYELTVEHQAALKKYLLADQHLTSRITGAQLMLENNCLACHSRDLEPGIAAQFPDLADSLPDLADRLAAVAPPSLSSVGDKLHDAALAAAIVRVDQPRRRPWLDVQMPKFRLSESHVQRIVNDMISHDRIPEATTQPIELPNDIATELAAGRLVTAEGFGCQSCHQIADSEPPKVALNAHGSDLTMLGDRVRASWFQRWVRNPSRIVPRMEMPAIQTPARGVLNDSLDLQLAALWKTLNTPGFRPPQPNPVRIVRNSNMNERAEGAHVLTDVIDVGTDRFLRPLVFGLPNRHNVLFDLERGELSRWWIGDTARQLTKGKYWYWQAGARTLIDEVRFLERITVVDSMDRIWEPVALQQVAVKLDAVKHTPRGVVWSGSLHLSSGESQRDVHLQQTAEPDGQTMVITTRLTGLQQDERLRIQVAGQLELQNETVSSQLNAVARLNLSSETHTIRQHDVHSVLLTVRDAASDQAITWTSRYITNLPDDRFPMPAFVLPPREPKPLDCVPGYEAIELPLPITEMPISFAWDNTGGMYAGSLKGHVVRVIDRDDDGLGDDYEIISDQLPTPYGLHYGSQGLDVLAKFALVRLQPNATGQVWDSQIVADGWGYTDDYHDWAVGLVVDANDNYLMALPCQQDDRSPAAANLRGQALKLVPDTSDPSRMYRIEPIAAGLRFPMGIALSPSGDLFTTDNQGNYNAFNELNHLRQGLRYGFINKIERRDGFSPPYESPAINLPHPWTRSVNGICFLQTPASAGGPERKLFGPFEGHLLGCEMNNRSLIRMSLQRVGDTYQGAAYLFSQPTLDVDEGFEGPIVCDVGPTGDVWVGNLQDSGWGGGQNTGSIVRLRPQGELPLGIAEVRAHAAGFTITFTSPVVAEKAIKPENYQLRSYRRISTPAYGGDDQDQRDERVRKVQLADDRRQIELLVDDLRAGFVYEINVAAIGSDDDTLFPNQAHYTMRAVPE